MGMGVGVGRLGSHAVGNICFPSCSASLGAYHGQGAVWPQESVAEADGDVANEGGQGSHKG